MDVGPGLSPFGHVLPHFQARLTLSLTSVTQKLAENRKI
jgi:hypothetical protein